MRHPVDSRDGRTEILLVAGTRSEAIKLAPVAIAMRDHPRITPVIVDSGQHGAGVRQAFRVFGVSPDVRLRLRRRSGGQAELVNAVIRGVDDLLLHRTIAAVVVQGDTSTGLATALTSFWRQIPIVHLEAGLRTQRLDAPFPEEGNRQMIARIAMLHLAPTPAAAEHLRCENVPAKTVVVTGNTVVDAVNYMIRRPPPRCPSLDRLADALANGHKLVIATLHRRESWGAPLRRALAGVLAVVAEHPDVHVLFPVHPNPAVRDEVLGALAGQRRIWLTPALDYPTMIWALRHAALVITDSGGLQEEAAVLNVPVVITRTVTERTESVRGGSAEVVGTDPERIRRAAATVLLGRVPSAPPVTPYGDGSAARRVVAAISAMVQAQATSPPGLTSSAAQPPLGMVMGRV